MRLLREERKGVLPSPESRNYIEQNEAYTFELDVENLDLSIRGNFLGEDFNVRNLKDNSLYQKTIKHIMHHGEHVFYKVFLEDVRVGNITEREYETEQGKRIIIKTNSSSPFSKS